MSYFINFKLFNSLFIISIIFMKKKPCEVNFTVILEDIKAEAFKVKKSMRQKFSINFFRIDSKIV